MTYRLHRLLMLWFVLALQALTPFVHAHAETVQPRHAGLLHVHPGAPGDVTYHAIESSGDQGEAVEGVEGMSLRQAPCRVAHAEAPSPAPAIRVPTAAAIRLGTPWQAAPPLHPSLPDDAWPHALAPPLT